MQFIAASQQVNLVNNVFSEFPQIAFDEDVAFFMTLRYQ